MIRLGVDLGGTKIEIIALLVDESQPLHKAQEVYRKRIDTPQGDYRATLNAITQLVLQAERDLHNHDEFDMKGMQTRIGIGIPGAISSKTGLIKNANSVCLIGQDLQGDLQRSLRQTVRLANDANCFTLSEATDGAAQGFNSVFGVIIGTGCGGGMVLNGEILNGANAIGGEWGHNPLPWATADDTPLECYCGLKGCLETYVSGSGLQRHYQQRQNQSLNAKQIEQLALDGDEHANQLLEDYCVWLAKGLASVVNIYDPEVIVLGGGMSNLDLIYQRVPHIWQQWIFSDEVNTLLKPPMYGDSSGVRGAAWL
ncbi:ROK family protein [Thiomicrorhabdus sediminis]|uniref:ROK family protein n=1 Tax=Thiomicrorhabdus sediminis TaxID=2580412 RepID=UPI001930FBE4|nr:ROK family protein [Thiomicrorhabdus sediminis]